MRKRGGGGDDPIWSRKNKENTEITSSFVGKNGDQIIDDDACKTSDDKKKQMDLESPASESHATYIPDRGRNLPHLNI